jgi:hypothetical protein
MHDRVEAAHAASTGLPGRIPPLVPGPLNCPAEPGIQAVVKLPDGFDTSIVRLKPDATRL